MAEPPSSPPPESTCRDGDCWYKQRCEFLTSELADFQISSRDLEAELEKEVEDTDRRLRDLQAKNESYQFEVDEWKEKCRTAKAEANAAQNTLEKEITSLRETNRDLTFKLRDIEVANDDFERQARNTTSSLDDLETKYNGTIEKNVILEDEIRLVEQEREDLRIESQRLREELSDLKVEAEIMQDKLKKAEDRHLSVISTNITIPDSPTFENSPRSIASSPLVSTPPEEISPLPPSKVTPAHREPPSPPMSDASIPLPKPASKFKTPARPVKSASRLPSADHSTTPKPRSAMPASTKIRQSGIRSATATATATRTPAPSRTMAPRTASQKIPESKSLHMLNNMNTRVNQVTSRIHGIRAKLPSKVPAPVSTPPRASPRSTVTPQVPSTVTMRSRKRAVGSIASSSNVDNTPTQSTTSTATNRHVPRLSTSGIPRTSIGPVPNRNSYYDPDSSSISVSRPSSRASISGSYARPDRPASRTEIARPVSRASLSGARTPMGLRPRSSIGGNLHAHGHSQSVSYIDTTTEDYDRTPSRRGTYSKFDMEGGSTSAIPTPNMGNRRQSGGGGISMLPSARRTSGGFVNDGSGGGRSRKLSDLGETY